MTSRNKREGYYLGRLYGRKCRTTARFITLRGRIRKPNYYRQFEEAMIEIIEINTEAQNDKPQ